MVDNSQEYRLKHWTTRLSVCSFARTAHSFACSGLLASLAPSAALTRSLARSLCSLPRSWESEVLMSQNDLILSHSGLVPRQITCHSAQTIILSGLRALYPFPLTRNPVLQHDLLDGTSFEDVFDDETGFHSRQIETGAVPQHPLHGIHARRHHDARTVNHLDVLVQFHLRGTRVDILLQFHSKDQA